MCLQLFHPLVRQWFEDRFGQPTAAQNLGWPQIAAGQHTLIAAPTGSGKTLAAFLVCLDRLTRLWLEGELTDRIQVVYVSPLKALSNDIERNLQQPLAEIRGVFQQAGQDPPPLKVAVRTGDTTASQRQSMLRHPPHILVTTPESLFLLLTSAKGRERLRAVRTVIVDEIHALARDKRGSHLALTLERLTHLCAAPVVRIGLSATQRPLPEIARFLVGEPAGDPSQRQCALVDVGHVRQLDLAIDVPPSELAAVCSHEQWSEVYGRLTELIGRHRSTLIFVNTRRLAERIAHNLRELLGEEAVAAHHGSLSRQIRVSAEERLKAGQLQAIVATGSLELGIDIGYIDLVCQIGSPRCIATFLQRVGRSGHSLGAIPKGRLFPLTRDELLECLALTRAVHHGQLDAIELPQKPLDILAQQIIAETACQEWTEEGLFDLCRRAYPYRDLTRQEFLSIVELTSQGVAPGCQRGAYLYHDRIHGRLKARRSARLAALTSGGAIPETAQYRVVAQPERTLVGTLDEHFAVESSPGDVFLLGNASWRVQYLRGTDVVVSDAEGVPPTLPFWFGEAPGRTIELSREVGRLRADIARQLDAVRDDATGAGNGRALPSAQAWLQKECGACQWGASQAVQYVGAQRAAVGFVPTHRQILFERFFDESGGTQLAIHAPFGARINRAWGAALRKRFCRSFDFELQAAATDDGILLSQGPQHSVPSENLFKIVRPDNGRYLLEQALLAAPMFQVRWRWNVTRALAVLRQQLGKRVPPHLQRFRSDDLLAAVFPQTVGCLENHHGDIEIPDHPLVRQTVHDCLHEAMDLPRWLELLGDIQAGRVELIACDTREPSPFCHELLNANPYAFLDDAPLEERRTRAVSTRRSLSLEAFDDLTKLDEQAIAQVRAEAWPVVRDADELHDALMSLRVVHPHEAHSWQRWLTELVDQQRAAQVRPRGTDHVFWIAAEHLPLIQSVYPQAQVQPQIQLPRHLQQSYDASAGWVELVRGRMQHAGPTTAQQLAEILLLESSQVQSALEALEGEGILMRGHFTGRQPHRPHAPDAEPRDRETGRSPSPADRIEVQHGNRSTQWCDRRLLSRIHRLTLAGLRKQIQPASPAAFWQFLIDYHGVGTERSGHGPVGVRQAIARLQGLDLPAAVWERWILKTRVPAYDPRWLDQLFLSGEIVWGRLQARRRTGASPRRMARLTRTVPISLMLRQDLPWLLPHGQGSSGTEVAQDPDREPTTGSQAPLAGPAQRVLDALDRRGALFFQELKAITQLLPAPLERALRELAAGGRVTSDAYGALRTMISPGRNGRGRRRRRASVARAPSIGRWSLFPGQLEMPDRQQYLEHWCRQLLLRYGILFRDLLVREPAAPRWIDLVPVLRQLELRGQIRGGRFVAGVAGEQFALEPCVRQLRDSRNAEPSGRWIVLSAADPLNLTGVLTAAPRIPANPRTTIIVRDGQVVAQRKSGETQFLQPVDPAEQGEMQRALQLGRRQQKRADAARQRVFTFSD